MARVRYNKNKTAPSERIFNPFCKDLVCSKRSWNEVWAKGGSGRADGAWFYYSISNEANGVMG